MDKTETFGRIALILGEYNLSADEMRVVLWRYVSEIPFSECGRLMEDETRPAASRQAAHQCFNRAMEHMNKFDDRVEHFRRKND